MYLGFIQGFRIFTPFSFIDHIFKNNTKQLQKQCINQFNFQKIFFMSA